MNFVFDTVVLDYDQRMARRCILSAIIEEISIFFVFFPKNFLFRAKIVCGLVVGRLRTFPKMWIFDEHQKSSELIFHSTATVKRLKSIFIDRGSKKRFITGYSFSIGIMVNSTTIRQLFCVVWTLSITGFAAAFCGYGSGLPATHHQLQSKLSTTFGRPSFLPYTASSTRSNRVRTFLVSEEDVLEAVEKAEELWAEALEARKEANALIDKAEEEATASAGTAKEAENIFQDKTTPVTMQELVQVDNAAKASLDATSLVNKAMEASDRARYDSTQMLVQD